MKEQGFQTKIIESIEQIGGVVVNGTYTKEGIADLICGYPKEQSFCYIGEDKQVEYILLHLHVEVKTKKDYEALFRNHITEVDGLYVVAKGFKGREVLQAYKLNEVRKKGGLAVFAYSFEQVKEYVNANS